MLPAHGMASVTIDTGSSHTLVIQEHMLAGGVSHSPNLTPEPPAWEWHQAETTNLHETGKSGSIQPHLGSPSILQNSLPPGLQGHLLVSRSMLLLPLLRKFAWGISANLRRLVPSSSGHQHHSCLAKATRLAAVGGTPSWRKCHHLQQVPRYTPLVAGNGEGNKVTVTIFTKSRQFFSNMPGPGHWALRQTAHQLEQDLISYFLKNLSLNVFYWWGMAF
jgi:hypothetical protein